MQAGQAPYPCPGCHLRTDPLCPSLALVPPDWAWQEALGDPVPVRSLHVPTCQLCASMGSPDQCHWLPQPPQGKGLTTVLCGTLLPLLPRWARVGNNRGTGFPFESCVGQGRAFGGQSAAVSPVCTHEDDVTRPPCPRYKSWWVWCMGTGSLQQPHPTAMSSAPASRSRHHRQGATAPMRLCLLLLLSALATATNPGITARLTPRALEFGESHAPEHL